MNLDEILQITDRSVKIEYNCEICNKQTIKQIRAIKKLPYLLCKDHLMEKIYGHCNNFGIEKNKEKIKRIKKEKYGNENYNNQEKYKQTCLKKYGVDTNLKLEINKQKSKQTKKERYNNENYNNTKKREITNSIKFGTIEKYYENISNKVKNTWQNKSLEELRNIAIKSSSTRSKLSLINDIKPDSIWEQSFIKSHPECKRGPLIKYEYNGKTHIWHIDFEWKGKLYEVKNPFYFDLNYPKWKPELTWVKWKFGEQLGIRWYLWNPIDMSLPFPTFDELENYRLSCWVSNHKSPKEAWYDYNLRFKAEENLAQQLGSGGKLLNRLLNNKKEISNLILERFTIAKIAPRVTSMSKIEAKKWLLESKLDLSKGIYDPCGGFGGRKKACEELGIKYEGYDVNENLIKLVGHSYQDLITMEPIITDKIVFTSPPWLDKECWPGSNGSITEIHEKEWWYDLIQQKIKAPHYILVNGSKNNIKRNNGLFGKRDKIALII